MSIHIGQNSIPLLDELANQELDDVVLLSHPGWWYQKMKRDLPQEEMNIHKKAFEKEGKSFPTEISYTNFRRQLSCNVGFQDDLFSELAIEQLLKGRFKDAPVIITIPHYLLESEEVMPVYTKFMDYILSEHPNTFAMITSEKTGYAHTDMHPKRFQTPMQKLHVAGEQLDACVSHSTYDIADNAQILSILDDAIIPTFDHELFKGGIPNDVGRYNEDMRASLHADLYRNRHQNKWKTAYGSFLSLCNAKSRDYDFRERRVILTRVNPKNRQN